MSFTNRLQKLRQRLVEQEVDAILISQPENRRYLSGFDGSAGYLLITQQRAILATDYRYLEQAKKQVHDFEILQTTNTIGDWLPKLVAELNLKRLGFEAAYITFTQYRRLADILTQSQCLPIPTDKLADSLRAIKEAEEIELITKAVGITDSAFEYIQDIIYTGISEKEVAWELEKYLRQNGSETIPFDIIVASGPNSALPHAKPSSRTINSGEPIVIDIGARCIGYSSDLSRTICLGPADDIFNRVYDTVLGAQLAAIAMVKENMTGSEIDNVARTVIEEAGYGKAFGHALGHGIGLVPHEPPSLAPKSSEHLINGMVFTIEPGIYLTDWGGVRIEDVVVLEDGKAKVISKARKIQHDKWQ